MKILWVVRPAEGGILQHLKQLSTGISEWPITVAAPDDLKDWAGNLPFISLNLVDGLHLRQDLASIRHLRKVLRTENPGLVHAHGFKAALITAAALPPNGHPNFLFTAHNNLPKLTSKITRLGQSSIQRWMFGKMRMIISVSDAVRSQIIQFAPEQKVITIHNGIATKKFSGYCKTQAKEGLGLATSDLVVGTVARLIAGKGLASLLEAFSLVAKIIPNLKLVIVGDGPEREKLEKYAHGLGLGETAKFLGWRDDVPNLMAAWDCFVLPTLGEGFSLSVLEAMASQLPVVVSDLPCMREAVIPKQSGLIVPPGDVPELAAALLHLLKSPDKARAMGSFNRERVQTYFGEERMVRSIQALYEGLLT